MISRCNKKLKQSVDEAREKHLLSTTMKKFEIKNNENLMRFATKLLIPELFAFQLIRDTNDCIYLKPCVKHYVIITEKLYCKTL